MRAWGSWAGTVAVVLLAASAGADVFVLTNGDRVTGKRLRAGKRVVLVQTDYGRLTIPRTQVQKIVKDDGSEEYVAEPGAAPPPKARLSLSITGQSFWLAWDPKNNPRVDPSLRLELRLDGEVVATYTDGKQDPQDLPGTTVNTFSFLPADVEAEAALGVTLGAPEVTTGRATLKLDVPQATDAPARHTLRLSYQFNAGSTEEPQWTDAAFAETQVEMSRARPAALVSKQDTGKMAFSGFPKKRMRNIETFHMELTPATP